MYAVHNKRDLKEIKVEEYIKESMYVVFDISVI